MATRSRVLISMGHLWSPTSSISHVSFSCRDERRLGSPSEPGEAGDRGDYARPDLRQTSLRPGCHPEAENFVVGSTPRSTCHMQVLSHGGGGLPDDPQTQSILESGLPYARVSMRSSSVRTPFTPFQVAARTSHSPPFSGVAVFGGPCEASSSGEWIRPSA